MTIALVYNVKGEASSDTSRSAELSPSSPFPQVALVDPSSALLSSTHRVNDMYAEWDTMETVSAVRTAIEERFDVEMIEANEHAYGKLMQTRPDFVFNIAEGLHGVSREAQMPAIFEMLHIPYLGSDPLTLSICLDKSRAKEILSYHGIATPNFTVMHHLEECRKARVKVPAIVKPLHEGSSKGIYNSCVVRSTRELTDEVERILTTYGEPALVEEFLPGREFTVALLGNGNDVRVLPIVEIKFDALPSGMNPIYSYEAKWIWDTTANPLEIFECPAKLEPGLESEISLLCLSAYRILCCRDWSRIDVRLDQSGRPHIIEINPLPGILPKPEDNSCFPKAARASGMTYSQLINSVLDIALARCDIRLTRTQYQTVEIS